MIQVSKKTLSEALSAVLAVGSRKAAMPILDNVRITTKAGTMKLQCTDINTTIVKYIDCTSDSDVDFCVNVAALTSFVQKVSGDVVTLQAGAEELVVKHKTGQAKFAVVDTKEYPEFKNDFAEAEHYELPAANVRDAITACQQFVATDDLRPVMTGVNMLIAGDQITFCGTNSRIMCVKRYKLSTPCDHEVSLIIQPSVFGILRNACSQADTMSICATQKQICYRVGHTIIVSAIIDGKYPPFEKVIPTNTAYKSTVNKKDFMSALDRTTIMCNKDSKLIKLQFDTNQLTVVGTDIDYGKSSSESLDCVSTSALTIAFNSENLRLFCSAIQDDDLTFEMNGKDKAATASSVSRDTTVLIMPMMLP
jgi:DNA polymerase-3 subunit beta